MTTSLQQAETWSSVWRYPFMWRVRLAFTLWWRRTFWKDWDESQTPHRVFTTVCRNCGDRDVNVTPVSPLGRLCWECARCFKMTAFEERE